jgi:hypothetical protein
MIQKKFIVPGIVALSLAVTGVGVAATSHIDVAKSHTIMQNKAMPEDTTVMVIKPTPTEPSSTEPTPVSDAISSNTVTDTTVVSEPVEVTPADTLKQTIIGQATTIAPYFAWSSTDEFVNMQLYCLMRGVTADSSQAQLDSLASFLVPMAREDGRTDYRYFSGGCRVMQDIR